MKNFLQNNYGFPGSRFWHGSFRTGQSPMPKFTTGFTAVEMLVSLAIVGAIMSSVLFNYATFTDNLTLSSAGQEMAIVLRQAQTYGLTVKEVNPTGGNFDSAYGVYFNPTDSPSHYYLFADLDGNRKYNEGSVCGAGGVGNECVEKIPLRNGVTISDVCDGSSCPPVASARALSVSFLRPNPDASIIFTNNGGGTVASPLTGKVKLTSAKGKYLYITIESTGQVLAGEIN